MERNNCIVAGDQAKNQRKTLSKQIGMLMKEKKTEEAEEIKKKVEAASTESAAADEKLEVLDSEINSILAVVPNLLDDRCVKESVSSLC
jgi:seryl-tRNA synthetase